ncbi:unnamed protein product [Paramecium pentaurelia]|uniref:PX domain-containing protein n=1 Tax=Paramecium pentaurelia TaxID=43138 RepID=A0A8S1T113_9CILI|nr:unnamed protein product [Paramecium pentaurelia]
MPNWTALIVFSYLLPASISVLFIIGMAARFYDLRSNIQAEPLPFNYSIILRITLLTLDITAEFVEFILMIIQDEDKNYYISGVLFVNISAIIMQIILMTYEYKKQVPMFFAHKIYWVLNWLFLSITLTLLIFYNGKIFEYTLLVFRVLDYTILIIFTLFIRRQDLAEFEALGFWRSELPMIDLSESQRPRTSTVNNSQSSFLLKIDVKKQWNIVDDDIEIKLDVIIIGADKQYKLKKRISEIFYHHQQYVFENNDYFELHSNDLLQVNFLIKQMQESQDLMLINQIQKYFNFIISKLELITPSFVEFIQLQNSERMLIEEMKLANHAQNLHKSSMIVRKNQPNKKYKWDIQSQYLPYLDVRITEFQTIKNLTETYVQYTLMTQYEDETLIVQRRFKEFYEFSELMKNITEIKYFPPFPQKSLIKMSNEEIEERKQDLEIFMKVLLNDRQYHVSALFKFIGMSQYLEDQIKNLQARVIKESELIIKLHIKNTGFEEVVGKDGEKFIRYSFMIGSGDSKHTIWKRFSQFDELHSILKQRYPLLPQLPYKTTAALQQINPNVRCVNLQQYLLDLIKVPTIGENGHLRQFLEVRRFENNVNESGFEGSYSQFDNILQKLDNNNKDIEQLENMHNRLWQ